MEQKTGFRQGVPGRTDRPFPLPRRIVVGAGILVGFAGNLVIQSPTVPGLGMLVFFVALAAAVGTVSRRAGLLPSREAWSWVAAGVLLSSAFALRASPGVQVIAFLAASMAFALPALRAGRAWMRGSGVIDYVEAVVGAAAHAGLGAFRLAAAVRLSPAAVASTDSGELRTPGLPAVLRGLLLAAPLLFVFGALFVSADRVFAELVEDLLGTAVEQWLSHIILTAIVAWLATGYLTGFLAGTQLRDLVEVRMRRPSVGIVEIGIALGLLSILFTAFIGVQFRYLFGGAGLVEVTPGLTYAEYAREGFGQLAVVSALVLPTLLASDWLLGRPGPRARTTFRVLGGLQLMLLLLVILSAFQRVRAYQEAYGLTESRFYGVVFLGWLTLVSVWFGITVLRGRREQFAYPALLSAFVVAAGLVVANPDAWIVRANLARSTGGVEAHAPRTGTEVTRRLDIDYLASLSADAVPALLHALPDLPPETGCRLAGLLLEQWSTDREPDWRSWNLAVARARDRVEAEASELAWCH